MKIFSGAATAMVTPLKDGKVDYESFGRLIEMQIDGGISALVINGTTGEAATLSEAEKTECVRFASEKVKGRVPVIAGASSPSSGFAAHLAREARRAGADAILATPPYYNKCSPYGLYLHYKTIAESADLPLIAYNIPQRVGMGIPIDAYERLLTIDNLVAVKEASGNLSIAENIASRYGERIDIYSGCDELTVPIYAIGGSGVISVASNVLPRKISELCSLWETGEAGRAARMQTELYPLMCALFLEVNPIPVKCALAEMGLIEEEYRLPLCRMSEGNREKLVEILRKYV